MIELYIMNIRDALRNKCYFPALALTLTLPDVCGAVEYPKETSVAKRYIEWYDKCLGEAVAQIEKQPYLSGEVVYNLRNTFLHTGSPNIDSNKVKEEDNRLDRFILILGDATVILESTFFIDTPSVKYRLIAVDITHLCDMICNAALCYYEHNKDKFGWDFLITPQESITDPRKPPEEDLIISLINEKLEAEGESFRVKSISKKSNKDLISELLDKIKSDKKLKQELDEGKTVHIEKGDISLDVTFTDHNWQVRGKSDTPLTFSEDSKKEVVGKREAQIRSFFGEHFKEKKYKQKKEVIIRAVMKSKTKQQLNIALMKNFSSEETGAIYKKLKPLIKDLPGN